MHSKDVVLLFLVIGVTVILTRGLHWQVVGFVSLVVVALWAYTFPKIGVEFTYEDFRINDGLPAKLRHSQFLTRVRFHDKGIPYPVIGLEARRWLMPHVAMEATAQGYWFNKWNSGREEQGTVYDSQSGFETHVRLIYSNPRMRGFSPFVGVNYNYSKYTQNGSGVFNFQRVQMVGPEAGFNFSFRPFN
jgi:hypothetical protein